jgi:hypothetical protein
MIAPASYLCDGPGWEIHVELMTYRRRQLRVVGHRSIDGKRFYPQGVRFAAGPDYWHAVSNEKLQDKLLTALTAQWVPAGTVQQAELFA